MKKAWIAVIAFLLVGALLLGGLFLPLASQLQSAAGCSSAADGTGVRAMSYNIRTVLTTPPEMKNRLDEYDWQARGTQAVKWIRPASPDVIGFQENARYAGGRQADLLADLMPEYAWVSGIEETLPIAYRSGVMTVERSGTIQFSWKGRGGSDYNRYATWAEFLLGATGRRFVFVNVHAHRGSHDQQAAEVRADGWDILLPKLAEITGNNSVPTIAVGDFNALSTETKAVFDEHLVAWGQAGFAPAGATAQQDKTVIDKVSSLNMWGTTLGDGKWHYKAIRRTSRGSYIDYVWSSKANTRALTWEILTGPDVRTLKVDGTSYPFFSDAPLPSDHNPVVAQIAFNTAAGTGEALSANTGASVAGWNAAQIAIATQVVKAGVDRGLDDWTIAVAIMTGMGESSLTNIDHGDAARSDTIGVFQTGPEHGPREARMDPYQAAGLFYDRLEAVDGYRTLQPTIAAHRAQRNADPNHYTKYWEDAVAVLAHIRQDPTLANLAANNDECAPDNNLAGLPPFSGGDCPPTGLAVEKGLLATAARGLRCAAEAFPQLSSFGGRAGRPIKGSDHPTGLAVDLMVPDWNTTAGNTLGWQIAEWFHQHAAELNVKYIIWDAKKWNPEVNDQWRPYRHQLDPNGNNPNLSHRNHVHVSFTP